MIRSAVISKDGTYRYRLDRIWDENLTTVVFVMLNPSTANAEVDDPTIRRCINFAQRWGHGSLSVVNLFAYRATKPDDLLLLASDYRCGPDNNSYLWRTISEAETVVAAWGAHPAARLRRGLDDTWLPIHTKCLGHTKSGAPKHPLYVAASMPLVPYFRALSHD